MIFRDVTRRKLAQAALQASEERFKTVADFTYDWETWIDPNGNFVYCSPSCQRITGYKPADFEKDADLLSIIHPDNHSELEKHLHDEKDREKVFHLNLKIVTQQSKVRWIEHICQPVFAKDGRYLGRRASNRDITKRREIEMALYKRRHPAWYLPDPDNDVALAKNPSDTETGEFINTNRHI